MKVQNRMKVTISFPPHEQARAALAIEALRHLFPGAREHRNGGTPFSHFYLTIDAPDRERCEKR